MVKCLSILLCCFLVAKVSTGQKTTLIAEGTTPDLYLLHHVKPKQNFYSIGRMYNVSPKEISAYNHLQFENGLAIGQTIKIPLSATNFSQGTNDESSESLIPVYHEVQPKEGLFRISIKYNKVPMTTIKKWNHLASDNVGAGTKLIIGYLKVNPSESTLGKPQSESENIVSQNNPASSETLKTNAEPGQSQSNVSQNPKQPVPQNSPDKTTTSQKDDPKSSTTTVNNTGTVSSGAGYFKSLYNEQVAQKSLVSETGSAGVFKSTSGWQDEKYYCFSNDAPSGTVIKVTNNVTGKSVYAKVLDVIPDIEQNSGLNIIVSNAAAQQLGAGEKFDCALTFVK